MNKDLYVFPEPGMNAGMDETLELMTLLNQHGIPASKPWLELAPIKDATTQDKRTLPFEEAIQLGFDPEDRYYITFQIGAQNRTTAGYLLRLVSMWGKKAMVQRLFAEHVNEDPAAWERHLLSLPQVQKALEKAFK